MIEFFKIIFVIFLSLDEIVGMFCQRIENNICGCHLFLESFSYTFWTFWNWFETKNIWDKHGLSEQKKKTLSKYYIFFTKQFWTINVGLYYTRGSLFAFKILAKDWKKFFKSILYLKRKKKFFSFSRKMYLLQRIP